MLSHLHDLMVLASFYTWSAVCAFHYKNVRSIKMGLASLGASFDTFKQPFFLPTTLLAISFSSHISRPETKPSSSSPSQPSMPRNQICDTWSWHGESKNQDCPLHHICIICKHEHHAKVSQNGNTPFPHAVQTLLLPTNFCLSLSPRCFYVVPLSAKSFSIMSYTQHFNQLPSSCRHQLFIYINSSNQA